MTELSPTARLVETSDMGGGMKAQHVDPSMALGNALPHKS